MRTFQAVEDAYEFTANDGSTIWASGYTLLDEDEHYKTPSQQHFDDARCLLCRVAGTSHRPDALQLDDFAPGSAVMLRPDPNNAYDKNAVEVWDVGLTTQIGFVPAEVSPIVAAEMRAGEQLGGVILREFRREEHGRRVGLHMLIAPVGALRLDIESPDDDKDDEPGN